MQKTMWTVVIALFVGCGLQAVTTAQSTVTAPATVTLESLHKDMQLLTQKVDQVLKNVSVSGRTKFADHVVRELNEVTRQLDDMERDVGKMESAIDRLGSRR